MDAEPVLRRIAKALADARLEAVLIGNAGAALHGAPVTTDDFDFLVRHTPQNIKKIKAFAKLMGGASFEMPYYPVSNMIRVASRSVQVDFPRSIHGIRSFEGLRNRSEVVSIHGYPVLVASLKDIIKSKKAAGRAKDMAVMPVLEATLDEQQKKKAEESR